MTIKASLLMSIPIIKRFWPKIVPPKWVQKFMFLGVWEGKFFYFEVETPLGNQSTPEHVVWRKNGGDTPKNVFSRAAQEITNEKNLKIFFLKI